MTRPRPWPDNARNTRDDVAALLQDIIRIQRPLLRNTDKVIATRAGLTIDNAHRAIRLLMQVGAQVQEDNL